MWKISSMIKILIVPSFLDIMNNAAMKILLYDSLDIWDRISLGYMPSNGLAGP